MDEHQRAGRASLLEELAVEGADGAAVATTVGPRVAWVARVASGWRGLAASAGRLTATLVPLEVVGGGGHYPGRALPRARRRRP